MTCQRDEQGFTLVELLVALAIMALAAALVLPLSTRSGETRRLDALAQEIAANLRIARDAALAGNREARVTFDLESHEVTGGGAVRRLPIPSAVTLLITTAEGEAKGKQASFRFFPDGGATGGNIAISWGQGRRDIAVNWLTGAVVIEDGATP